MDRARTRPVTIGALLAVVLIGLGVGALALHHRARQATFARVCTAAPVGSPVASLDAAFLAIGERSSGHGWRGDPSGPPDEHHWFRRTGLSRFQQCTVEVDRSTQRIVRVSLDARTDFTSCRNPVTYPHRHWLCVIGDSLAL